ncbi:MAG: dihydroxy-acid dehydratase [Deltaproteobacteria bacterium]|nr:dihydroxy-acid dehydratase [Deltaproteobacteria bacterium]
MRSSESTAGLENAFARSLYKAMGFSSDDLTTGRPMIGIANSWNNLVPGHYNLNQIGEFVKKGIYRAGGTAFEFGIIACCDGIAMGHTGMHYVLPSREVVCNAVEISVEAHRLDGVVLLASCDKIVPGMLMAAARLDIPAIVVTGGTMYGGVVFDKRKTDATSVSEALGMYKANRITLDEFNALEDLVCPSCGSCSFFGTANTMGCLAEAMGMSLPDGGLIPATHPDRFRLAEASGEMICQLVRHGINARQVINKRSLENAVRVCLGVGGSTNAVLHLAAIAYEAEVDMDILGTFESMSKDTPNIVKVNPASHYNMEDFWQAGGVPCVMDRMQELLNTDVMTCSGKSLHENIRSHKYKFPVNNDVIRTLDNAYSTTGGIAVLRGNLAPATAVSKPNAIDPSVRRFTGRAVAFDYEEAANKAILEGRIKAGDVVVIRYEGPRGGPGMREMYMSMKYLHGMGLDKDTAVVTDGRFSGTNNGCFVGHVSPEAADGGPLSIVADGDKITIDVIEGTLHLHVPQEEIERRLKSWHKPEKKFKKGYLELYSRLASSANEGAIMKRGE